MLFGIKRFKKILGTNKIVKTLYFQLKKSEFRKLGSVYYWENRYRSGGNSGAGSNNEFAKFKAEMLNEFAKFKAEMLNKFIMEEGITSVIEWGCGDGNQIALIDYPSYIGLDVSATAIQMCDEKFKHDNTKKFYKYSEYLLSDKCDLAVSLDVIYCIPEDEKFAEYMYKLFNSSSKFVCIYSTNHTKDQIYNKHRIFTEYILTNFKEWKLYKYIENPYPPDITDPYHVANTNHSVARSSFYFYIHN